MSSKTHVTCIINGDETDFLTEDGESLLNALRDEVGLTGRPGRGAAAILWRYFVINVFSVLPRIARGRLICAVCRRTVGHQ